MTIIKRTFQSIKRNGIKNTIYLACQKIENEMKKHQWDTSKRVIEQTGNKFQIKKEMDKINIGIVVSGGLGDYIVSANYIYKLIQKYDKRHFDIYILVEGSISSAKTIFDKNDLFSSIISPGQYENRLYLFDIAIHISRYPEVKYVDHGRIMEVYPDFSEYIWLCEKYCMENERFFKYAPHLDGETAVFSIMNGDKRMTQPDIYNHLGLTEQYEYQIHCPPEKETLEKFDLFGKKYIVLHRGGDNAVTDTSVKMWPLNYYVDLVHLIREKYPNLILVQLGSPQDEKIDADIDYNYVGQTTLEDMKVLSKCCSVLIDNEGGIVHLRHALGGGKSIVLFGATSLDFFGYSDNINLYNSNCPICCEWTINKWQDQCLRGYPKPPCMESITPVMVMSELDKLIEGGIMNE